jgi:hypothetical protein
MRGREAQFVFAALWLGWTLVLSVNACAQIPLTITTAAIPSTAVGSNMNVTIVGAGGALPYSWELAGGKLPPGLRLDARSGALTGRPTTPGTYHFEVAVTDSSVPGMRIQRAFTLVVTAALSIDWKELPAVHGQKVEGSVIVTNQSTHDFTLTVIVMAVNQIGRATALGYQKLALHAGAEQVIPFGSSPGPGTYVVHADAVAEVASTSTIYRARKQTSDHLIVRTL